MTLDEMVKYIQRVCPQEIPAGMVIAKLRAAEELVSRVSESGTIAGNQKCFDAADLRYYIARYNYAGR